MASMEIPAGQTIRVWETENSGYLTFEPPLTNEDLETIRSERPCWNDTEGWPETAIVSLDGNGKIETLGFPHHLRYEDILTLGKTISALVGYDTPQEVVEAPVDTYSPQYWDMEAWQASHPPMTELRQSFAEPERRQRKSK